MQVINNKNGIKLSDLGNIDLPIFMFNELDEWPKYEPIYGALILDDKIILHFDYMFEEYDVDALIDNFNIDGEEYLQALRTSTFN
jgi:hypothetical protein